MTARGVALLVASWALLAIAAPEAAASPPSSEPLLVGAATDHYPYSYLDASNVLTGFAVDLFDQVARVGGLSIRRITGPSVDLTRRFFAGEFPVAQVYAYTPGRQGRTGFSAPYLTLKGALFVRRDGARIDSLSDLAGRSVIVGLGSAGEEFLRRPGVGATLVPVDTADASLDLLAQGKYDAALTSRLTGMAIVARSGYRNVRLAGPPIDDLTVSLCFASHDADRLVQINEALAILYRTGDYDRIYRRWFARYEPASFTAEDLAHYGAAVFFVVAIGAVWMSWPAPPQRARGRAGTRAADDGGGAGAGAAPARRGRDGGRHRARVQQSAHADRAESRADARRAPGGPDLAARAGGHRGRRGRSACRTSWRPTWT